MMLKKIKFVILTIGFATLSISCVGANDVKLSEQIENANILLTVNKFTNAKSLSIDGTMVYGKIEVSAKNKLKTVNLDCIGLAFGDKSSEKIYVNSIASVLTSNFSANKNGDVIVDVYWSFPGIKPEILMKNSARIELRKSDEKCIRFSGA